MPKPGPKITILGILIIDLRRFFGFGRDFDKKWWYQRKRAEKMEQLKKNNMSKILFLGNSKLHKVKKSIISSYGSKHKKPLPKILVTLDGGIEVFMTFFGLLRGQSSRGKNKKLISLGYHTWHLFIFHFFSNMSYWEPILGFLLSFST